MNTQTGEGPSGVAGQGFTGAVFFHAVPAAGRGGLRGVVSLERSSVRARSGQETFTTLCVRNIVSCQVFFSVCPLSS